MNNWDELEKRAKDALDFDGQEYLWGPDVGLTKKETAYAIKASPTAVLTLIEQNRELLEALKSIADHYDMDGYGNEAWKNLAIEMASVARSAIRKATGEEA